MSKHDAVKAYFVSKVKELAGSMLNFNFSPESPNSISLLTNYSDKVRKKYITGDALKEYGFSIIIVKEYSSESDDLNLEAMNFAQTFMEWLEEQNEKKEYPDFVEFDAVFREELSMFIAGQPIHFVFRVFPAFVGTLDATSGWSIATVTGV